MVEHIKRLIRWESAEPPAAKLDKLEQVLRHFDLPLDEMIPLFAALLSLPVPEDRYPPLSLTPQQQKQHTLDMLMAWTFESAEREPLLGRCGRTLYGRSLDARVPRFVGRADPDSCAHAHPDVPTGVRSTLAAALAHHAHHAESLGAAADRAAGCPPRRR